MSSIEISLPDSEEIMTRLNAVIERTPEQLDEVLQQTGIVIEGALKMLVQSETHGSGLTAASIETRKEDTLVYGVGSYYRGHILRFLDKGTGIYGARGAPILIQPVARQALHFWIKETGNEAFAAYCIVMGIIPFNFFERAVSSHLNELDDIVKEKVKM